MYFALQPHMQEHVGATAEDLSHLMTQRCFAECTLNEHGRADFDSFASWLLRGDFGEAGHGAIEEEEEETASGDERGAHEDESDEPVRDDASGDDLPGPQLSQTSLAHVRQLTKLQEFSAQEVCEIFEEQSSKDGVLTREEFRVGAQLIVQCGGGHDNAADKEKAEQLHDTL